MIQIFKHKTVGVELTYMQGVLLKVERDVKVKTADWRIVFSKDIKALQSELDLTKFKEKKLNTVAAKIAMWCVAYKAWSFRENGEEINYKPSTVELGQIKNVTVSIELLRAFFNNKYWPDEKTITCYCRNYNSIRNKAAAIANGKAKDGANTGTVDEALKRKFGG